MSTREENQSYAGRSRSWCQPCIFHCSPVTRFLDGQTIPPSISHRAATSYAFNHNNNHNISRWGNCGVRDVTSSPVERGKPSRRARCSTKIFNVICRPGNDAEIISVLPKEPGDSVLNDCWRTIIKLARKINGCRTSGTLMWNHHTSRKMALGVTVEVLLNILEGVMGNMPVVRPIKVSIQVP